MENKFLYKENTIETNTEPNVREKLLEYGVSAISDAELIAAILGCGIKTKSVQKIAKEITDNFDLGQIPEIKKLICIGGLGNAQACRIVSALELGRRFYGWKGQMIKYPEQAWQQVKHYADLEQEVFLCISLNASHGLLSVKEISRGLINRTLVHPREVFAESIKNRSCALVVAHNHPSGNVTPSSDDNDTTKALWASGEILGIKLLDHIIFSNEKYFSYAEHNMLPTNAEEL